MTLFVVIGPPASGKSTWVRQNAQRGDITIDYDAIANVLTIPDPAQPHDHPNHIRQIVRATRQAAIDHALTMIATVNVYVIHSTPSAQLLARYRAHGAQIVTIDPGREIVEARAKAERPWRIRGAVKAWYDNHNDPQSEPTPPPAPAHEAPPPRRAGGISQYAGRSTRRYKKLRTEFREKCRTHTNPDGTTGAPCWLCGRPIDYELPVGHPESFNLDHVHPVSERPDLAEDPANFRPCHQACNERRGVNEPHIELGERSEAW